MIYWLLFILLEIGRNYYLIEIKNTKPIYFQSFILRGMAAILTGIFIFESRGTFDNIYDISQLSYWDLFMRWWSVLSFQVASFFTLFSPILNLIRGKKITYRGKDSGWLDSLPVWVYWFIYIVCLLYTLKILINGNLY